MNFYNDNDAGAVQWLRELVANGHLPHGRVDERPIQEITAADLAGFTACHFFGGIGGWPLALRLAGWPESRPVWTASCPCQPFSAAGKRRGQADERHLWPVFFRLVRECRPATIFGEQVASDDGYRWLARVRDDLEEAGYAVGCADLPACSAGAPHIRQRLFWVADAGRSARGTGAVVGDEADGRILPGGRSEGATETPACRRPRGLADAERLRDDAGRGDAAEPSGDGPDDGLPGGSSGGLRDPVERLGHTDAAEPQTPEREEFRGAGRREEGRATGESGGSFWSDSILIPPAETEKRGVLNPAFSLWLQGYPAAWASCGARGIALCRKSRRSSSGRSSKPKAARIPPHST